MSWEPLMPNEDRFCAYLDGECTDAERAWVEEQIEVSAEARAVLGELTAARDAVRALPRRDASPEFWARMLGGTESMPDAPVDLAARRTRRSSRWFAAATAAAAAAVIAAVILVPERPTVTPPMGVFTDAHAVRTSLQNDATSSLAPLAVAAGFHR